MSKYLKECEYGYGEFKYTIQEWKLMKEIVSRNHGSVTKSLREFNDHVFPLTLNDIFLGWGEIVEQMAANPNLRPPTESEFLVQSIPCVTQSPQK